MFLEEEKKKSAESDLSKIDMKNFDNNRKLGEDNSYICQLIRYDSIDEFISFTNQNNLSLSSKIQSSIFETNSLLMQKEPTLIEYAAFYRSVKIFQYLQSNHIELTPSLWFYSIHGQKLDLIFNLEENNAIPETASYAKCFEESIKCHHN